MPKIEIGPNEPLDKALRRLKRQIEREGTLRILRQRKHYEKPSERKRRKLRESRSRIARKGP